MSKTNLEQFDLLNNIDRSILYRKIGELTIQSDLLSRTADKLARDLKKRDDELNRLKEVDGTGTKENNNNEGPEGE